MPRLAQLAGLEIGTGVHLNVHAPEAAAERLRAASVRVRRAVPPTTRRIPLFAARPPRNRCPMGAGARRSPSSSGPSARADRRDRLVPRPHLEGRTYVPATAPAADGGEWVRLRLPHAREGAGAQATDFVAGDFTEETADQNPDWSLDLSDHEIGHWRGHPGPARGDHAGLGRRARVKRAVATAELGLTARTSASSSTTARSCRSTPSRATTSRCACTAARRRAGARVALRRRRR